MSIFATHFGEKPKCIKSSSFGEGRGRGQIPGSLKQEIILFQRLKYAMLKRGRRDAEKRPEAKGRKSRKATIST